MTESINIDDDIFELASLRNQYVCSCKVLLEKYSNGMFANDYNNLKRAIENGISLEKLKVEIDVSITSYNNYKLESVKKQKMELIDSNIKKILVEDANKMKMLVEGGIELEELKKEIDKSVSKYNRLKLETEKRKKQRKKKRLPPPYWFQGYRPPGRMP